VKEIESVLHKKGVGHPNANGELNARNLFEVHPIRHVLQLVSSRIRHCIKC